MPFFGWSDHYPMEKKQKKTNDFTSIILDIEGTTTSISFVVDVLFPYVRKNFKIFIENHLESIQDLLKRIVQDAKENLEYKEKVELENLSSIYQFIEWNMDLDKKLSSLKELQGLVYEEGYKQGKIQGHIYEDVLPAFKRWKEQGKFIYIYSSGSVFAQKLLFLYSIQGDLLKYIDGHFDTVYPGSKLESESYFKISKDLFEKTKNLKMIFLTDNLKEAEASNKIGIESIIINRDRKELEDIEFIQLNSFDSL